MTKILPCRFKVPFATFNMSFVHKCSDMGLFRHLSNPAFCSLEFKKQITSEAFFSKYSKFLVASGNAAKFQKRFSDLEIITFKLVNVNTRFY